VLAVRILGFSRRNSAFILRHIANSLISSRRTTHLLQKVNLVSLRLDVVLEAGGFFFHLVVGLEELEDELLLGLGFLL